MAAQIVTGVGFLGAGVIFREGYTVSGITTAATIWAAAAVGVAVGLELYFVAVFGAVFVFALLEARVITRRVEKVLTKRGDNVRNELQDFMEASDEESDDNPPERHDD